MAFVPSLSGVRRGASATVAHGEPDPVQPLFADRKVIGVGAAGVDLLAAVDKFPNPDDKLRTRSFEVAGGGNCANTLTALRRLGVPSEMITKIGDDSTGRLIADSLSAEGVSTSNFVIENGMTSAFTYIIVDLEGQTRTCIHTPARSDLFASDVDESWLDGVTHVHLDGRHTEAALQVAKHARRRKIPISIDVERDRPYIRELLPLADYLVTNARYPKVFASDFYAGMHSLLNLGEAQFVISTLGKQGSVIMFRADCERAAETYSNVEPMEFSGQRVHVVRCPAAPVDQVVDSTGAGDAFIGGVIYGLVAGMPTEKMLSLASVVASHKLQKPGARMGLPRWTELEESLV